MSENGSRWDVDLTHKDGLALNDFDYEIRVITNGFSYSYQETCDFIIKLSHEIRRLETDLIEAQEFANDAIETSMALAWNAWRIK